MKYLRALLFSCIAVMLFVGCNRLYKQTNYYRALNNLHKFENVPTALDVVHLGSSHTRFGIDYAEFPGINAFNFALDSQLPYFDLQLLRLYQNHISKGAYVFIELSYFSLYESIEFERKQLFPRYYRILPLSDIPKPRLLDWVRYKVFPIISAGKGLEFMVHDQDTLVEAFITPQMSPEEQNAYAVFRANKHLKTENTRENRAVTEQVDSLRQILEMCRQNEWRPVLVTLPAIAAYTDCFTDTFKALFREQIQTLFLVPYPETIWMDYAEDPRFQHRHELFLDSDHFNQQGRLDFTRLLFSETGVSL